MRWIWDIVYIVIALLTSPVWLVSMIRTGKIRTDWRGRFGHVPPEAHRETAPSPTRSTRVLFHAVSVGEVNAIRTLVDAMHEQGHDIVIATTTNTGFARARTVYGQTHQVVRYPFDFSRCVNRFLDAIRPDLVVLVELEVWPTFVALCDRRTIPVVVVNGRLSANSFKGYKKARAIVGPTFRRLSGVGAQDDDIAARFVSLGCDAERVKVLGTLKWDTAAEIATDPDAAAALGRALGIDPTRPLVVAGSTAPGEEALIRAAMPAGVQLLVAPRKPERFDEAARILDPCVRRSAVDLKPATPSAGFDEGRVPGTRFLLDTIGELRLAYALADVVIVGRTLVPGFGGSDMIEPIALGRATIVGPHVENFAVVASMLRAGGGMVQVDASGLREAMAALLENASARSELASAGRAIIEANRGVTEAYCAFLAGFLAGTR